MIAKNSILMEMTLYPNDRKNAIDEQLQHVCNSLGVSLEREYLAKGHDFEITLRLPELPKPYGLAILIGDDYLSWRLELSLDHYSGVMLDTMQRSFVERFDSFQAFANLATSRNNKFTALLNGAPLLGAIDAEWKDFNLVISKSYSTQESEFSTLGSCLLDFFCLVLVLLIAETEWNMDSKDSEIVGNFEGELSRVQVNKYERNRYNRALCLAFFGFGCRGCGQLLEEKYGPLGTNVIHVHHLVPVSQMGSSYRLDPIRDLIPLCPNCHNIVHKKNPPLPIRELRSITGYLLEDNFSYKEISDEIN
jgi:5-methylcytosine-specific restriction protein A